MTSIDRLLTPSWPTCAVGAWAAAWIAGADRWSEARWADLEAQLGTDVDDDADAPPAAGAMRPIKQVLRRRSVRSSYMG